MTILKLDGTLSAPVYKMFAKLNLGLADYLIRKAANMRFGFLGGKAKSKKNHIISYHIQKFQYIERTSIHFKSIASLDREKLENHNYIYLCICTERKSAKNCQRKSN